MTESVQVYWVHYFPIGTTLVAVVFSTLLLRRYLERRTAHLLWWAIGVGCYGVGTLTESLITIFGNTMPLTKIWYVGGAVLGGYPLAQGSVYLSHSKRFADRTAAITVPFVVLTSVLVFVSPGLPEMLQPHRPSGAVLGWRWVRLMTPFINTYAAFFLIGGAAVSAWRYRRAGGHGSRAVGNALIAVGALLPGIGGSIAKAGPVEPLYLLEFVGLILIWVGDRVCAYQPIRNRNAEPAPPAPA